MSIHRYKIFKLISSARAEPRKKKKIDPRREQAQKDRMKKKIKKLEKAALEMIPIEDFVTPFKFLDASRYGELLAFTLGLIMN